MKELIALIALSSLPLATLAQSDQSYLDSVCSPQVDPDSSVIPPCISVQTIESICAPKGKSSSDFAASADCICKAPSSYFADWLGCRKCLQVHGGFSEQQYNAYVLQAAAASSTMCQGSPTGSIADVFANAQVDGTPTGATAVKDQFPSETAVSLYYTPKGKQGPGGAAATEAPADATASNSGSEPSQTASTGSGDSLAAGGSAQTSTDSGKTTNTASAATGTSTSAAVMNGPLAGMASLALAGVVASALFL